MASTGALERLAPLLKLPHVWHPWRRGSWRATSVKASHDGGSNPETPVSSPAALEAVVNDGGPSWCKKCKMVSATSGCRALIMGSDSAQLALSSAESEHYSMVRSEAIGLSNTTRERGHEAQTRIWTEAAAARGLALRSTKSAIKHMETKYFWLQQKEKNQELRIEKIRGTINPADLMTKHLDGKRWVTLCELSNIKRVGDDPVQLQN